MDKKPRLTFDPPQWISGQPLYRELVRHLADALHKGVWLPGEAIPSEVELKRHYGLSIGTIRKAVDELVAKNILVRQQGRGTFVVSHDTHRYFFAFFRIAGLDGKLEYPGVELLRFALDRADAKTARALRIGVSERVWCFVNRLSLKGAPAIIDRVTVPTEIFPGLNEDMLRERVGTVYSFYQQSFGVNVVRTQEHLRAVGASGSFCEWLRVKPGAPLLHIARSAYTYRDRPVELRESLVNCEHHEYCAEPVYGKNT